MTDLEQTNKKQKIEENEIIPESGFDHVYIISVNHRDDDVFVSECYRFNATASKYGRLILDLLEEYKRLKMDEKIACCDIFLVLAGGVEDRPPWSILADRYFPLYNLEKSEDSENNEKPLLPSCIEQLLQLDDYGVWERERDFDEACFCSTRPVNMFCLIGCE